MRSTRLSWCFALLSAGAPWLHGQSGVIEVYSSGSVAVGATRQLSAYVSVSPNTIVWSVNGINGGNSTYGTISASGLYAAPAAAPPDNVVTVRATSTAFAAKFGSASIAITQKVPWVWSTNPSSFPAGTVTLNVNGAAFVPTTIIKAGGQAWATTYVSPTSLKATGTVNATGPLAITATNPGNGAVTSQPFMATVTAPPPPAPPTISSINPSSVQAGAFSLTILGSGFVAGSQVSIGGQAAATTYVSASQLTAPGSTNAAVGTLIPVTVANPAPNAATSNAFSIKVAATPAPNVSKIKAGRFLEQAAFGPTPAEMDKILQMGTDAWLDQQLTMAETPIPVPASMGEARGQYLNRLAHAPDQVRQKTIWALGQIIVVSSNKNNYPAEYVPYLQILSKHAFGNYRALLREIATSPQMGKYLDMANSIKPGPTSQPNENFVRELKQLFTIGLYQLNPDGSNALDGQGKPIPTYSQNDIRQFALAATGWTYPGANATGINWENFSGPLQPRPTLHDTTAKTLLNGATLPPGQTPDQDLDGFLDNLFLHPNTAPFVATRLVRAFASSNASPAFIQRVAAVFVNNGANVRGDLKAVVKAILTDPEARQDTATPNQGRLKDPIYQTIALTRALNGQVSASNQRVYLFVGMGQMPLTPNSVFGFYSPMYRIPGSALFGPEFQIYSPTEAVLRGNLFQEILSGYAAGDFSADLTPFQAVAGNTAQLVDAVDDVLTYGRMGSPLRAAIAKAVDAQNDNSQRVFTALYLGALSGHYAVQY